jgi:hypothetical protein
MIYRVTGFTGFPTPTTHVRTVIFENGVGGLPEGRKKPGKAGNPVNVSPSAPPKGA